MYLAIDDHIMIDGLAAWHDPSRWHKASEVGTLKFEFTPVVENYNGVVDPVALWHPGRLFHSASCSRVSGRFSFPQEK